jgi:glucose/arabinose dehydrogenase
VTNLAGSGSQYLVNVSAAQYGTYNLDIVPNSGITDMAGNPLADGDPLVDQSFHVPSPAVVPELATMPDRTVNELSALTFVADVTNGDLLVGPLTYGLDGGPAGAAMDPATGSFEWTPAETQNGGHTVTVTVSDSNGLTDSQDVAVTVNEVNTNPVLDEIPDQTVDTSSTLTFVASATDDDRYPGVGVETVAANLQIPWSIDWIPDGAALFTERGGSLRIIRDGVLAPDPLLSLSVSSGEGGLLGVAVDPDFGDNHYIYLYYSTRGTDNALINKVVRYQFANGTVTEDRVLVDGIPGAQYHDGGRIQFGPDGKLYITTGDAGRLALAQDLDSLAGKILRIDRNGTVPAGNPFANSPVWSFGHRNPQGLDWDAAGNLVATEHGPSGERGRAHDEINLILPGANYGWPNVIGGEFEEGMREPILHTGSDTWAPSGAEFYDGDRIPGWTGKYFVAALRGAHLHMVDLDLQNNTVISNEKLFQDEFGRLRDVQTGPDGLLYLLTSNRDGRGSPVSTDDRILRIVPVPDADRSRPANTLTYGLDGGPGGASIDPVTGTFVWAPAGNRETGTVTFNVTVSDGRGGTDMQTVRVHVSGTITPQVPQTPRGIGEITLTSTGPGVIEASWEAPTETPADYRIAWAKVGEPYLTWTDLSGNAFPTSPSQTVTDLEEGEQYKVKVRARYSSGGPGDWSGEFTVTVAGTG